MKKEEEAEEEEKGDEVRGREEAGMGQGEGDWTRTGMGEWAGMALVSTFMFGVLLCRQRPWRRAWGRCWRPTSCRRRSTARPRLRCCEGAGSSTNNGRSGPAGTWKQRLSTCTRAMHGVTAAGFESVVGPRNGSLFSLLFPVFFASTSDFPFAEILVRCMQASSAFGPPSR